ncbi:MAG: energy transducer TonB [Lentimicrobiaceae bacterium]|jgi:TonB family protein
MKKHLLVLASILISVIAYSQTSKCLRNLEKGTTAVNSKSYEEGISYLSLSIDEFPTSTAYFNRAAAYYYLGDTCGLCNDLREASKLGNKEAEKLHLKKCILTDTIRETADSISEEFPGYSYSISMRTICSDYTSHTYRNAKGEIIQSVWITMPEFPGGDMKRNKFLAENIVYPNAALRKGFQGTVYISFVIDSDGKVADIKLLRGPGGGLNEEALRVVRMMPKWKPGTRKGKPVRVLFNMPIYFKLS